MNLKTIFIGFFYFRNIIDVGAMDSHNLEPHELNDRIKMYSHKLSQQWSTIQEDSSSSSSGMDSVKPVWIQLKFSDMGNFMLFIMLTGLLRDVPSAVADVLLSSTPIADTDLLMVFTIECHSFNSFCWSIFFSFQNHFQIKSFTQKSGAALNKIKVEHKEDLVVPFRIP